MQLSFKNYCFMVLLAAGTAFHPSCKNSSNREQVVPKKDTAKSSGGSASQNIDQSPMDISYCPADYPQNKMKGVVMGMPVARVIYSRPHKKGRIIFSDDPTALCQYGKPWRLGANEATEIEFFKSVMVSGKNINAGRYVLYCIPHIDKWELILNSNLDSWGLNIDPSKDLFKFEIPVQQQTLSVEDFTMLFQESTEGADLLMTWDNIKVLLPITFSK